MSIQQRFDEAGASGAPLYQLVYCSRASAGVDDDAVHGMIRSARRRNPQLGITGLLVFGGGVFFQWLEGPRQGIETLMDRLQADPRHHGLVTLSASEEARERLFPDWTMELVRPAQVSEVLADALVDCTNPASAALLQRMLAEVDAAGLHDA